MLSRKLDGQEELMKSAIRTVSGIGGIIARHHSTLVALRQLTGSLAAQQWMHALENAPCLVCSHPTTHRIDCAVSGFPLTCSRTCDLLLSKEKNDKLLVFKQIHEDITFTTHEEARTLLSSVLTSDCKMGRKCEMNGLINSWEEFMRCFTDCRRWLEDPRAVRLASAAYTYVVTLSQFVAVLRSLQLGAASNLNLHIVGARAEAMMPPNIWNELTDAHQGVSFDIKLIGDHIFSTKAGKSKPNSLLSIRNYPGFYHDIITTKEELRVAPDGFALFNPGIGHPKLRACWHPTLDVILRTGKPVLLTAFSESDQERDLKTLSEYSDTIDVEFLVTPRGNDFKSRCFQLDPLNIFDPVQTNSHFVVLRGRSKT